MCESCESGGPQIAAIWGRVSTPGQFDLSPESQLARVKPELQERGFIVPDDRVLIVDWTSLDLLSCQEFNTLRQWVLNREVHAIGVFDRDRLQADGLQRLMFMADCRDNGVQIVVCQGSEIIDSEEGQIVELALSIGKKRAVLRGQQGARDGLRDRVVLRGKPTNTNKLYGYEWLVEDDRYTLVRDPNHMIVRRIFREFMTGGTINGIARSLSGDGVPSPRGKTQWRVATIHTILKNPAYGGRWYGQRFRAVEPEQRKGNTYGRSSQRLAEREDWHWVKGVTIESPPVTWEQWEWVQERLRLNQLHAQRKARRKYLLRGIAVCKICGKSVSGDSPRISNYHYRCRTCRTYLNGPALENGVWNQVCSFLRQPEVMLPQVLGTTAQQQEMLEQHMTDLKELDRRRGASESAEQKAFRGWTRNIVSEGAYHKEIAVIKAEQKWLDEEAERIQAKIGAIQGNRDLESRVRELSEKLSDRLSVLEQDDDTKRFVLESLNARVVASRESTTVEIGVPMDQVDFVSTEPGRSEHLPERTTGWG